MAMMGDHSQHDEVSDKEDKKCLCSRFVDWISEYCDLNDEQRYALDGPQRGGMEEGAQQQPLMRRPVTSQPASPQARPAPFQELHFSQWAVGARARFVDRSVYRGGTVVWTGVRTAQLSAQGISETLVVLYLDEVHDDATRGTFEGQALLRPESRERRYLMLDCRQAQPMVPFALGDFCVTDRGDGATGQQHAGFVRKMRDNCCTLEPMNTNFLVAAAPRFETVPDYSLRRAAPPRGEEVSEFVPPIAGHLFDAFLGRNKGIQGRHNSCYLDTLLFSFFAFSDLLDPLLSAPDAGRHHDYLEVLNAVRHAVVFPLRACHFVSHHHVAELRRLIAARTGNDSFRTETRDIPECVDALFGRLLHVEPLLSVGRVVNGETFFDGAYITECLPMEGVRVPTSKQLLEHASVRMDFCFEQMPRCLMIQLPREAHRDALLLPSYRLDLKNLIHGAVKECSECRSNAQLQFQHLIDAGDLAGTFLCRECALGRRLELGLGAAVAQPRAGSVVDEDTEVTMAALICIERSHYNCFVRCGSDATERWVFFDSMYDQERLWNPETDEMEVVNIPLVEEVPQFRQWLDEADQSVRRHGHLDHFFASLGEGQQERARRIFSCPYNVIYRPSRA